MKTPYNEPGHVASLNKKWKRPETVKLVHSYEYRESTESQRDYAKRKEVPRSTLRYWADRKNSIDADPILVNFFESPVGIAFLHRLITSAHVCFTKAGAASIHNVSDF